MTRPLYGPPERDRALPPGSPEPSLWWKVTGKLDGRRISLRWRNGRWTGTDADLLDALQSYLLAVGTPDDHPVMSEWPPFDKAEAFARLFLSEVVVDWDFPWVDDGRII